MKILFIGDVVGNKACDFLRSHLLKIKHDECIDMIIANGENSADGNGITPSSAKSLLDSGVDVVTTGNHCFKRREMAQMYEDSTRILRPVNYADGVPGKGLCVIDFGEYSVAVVNLQGVIFMNPLENPFKSVEQLLSKLETPNIIVDFHAEATSEKKAMGFFLAGKVSAVVGTHTHVQTADETILGEHTGYITDAGMTGVVDSVLGIKAGIIIEKMITGYPHRYEYEEGVQTMNAVILGIDVKTGKCLSIKRFVHELL